MNNTDPRPKLDISSKAADHRLPDEVLRRETKALLIDGELSTSRLCQRVVAPLVREFDSASNLRDTLHQVRDAPYHVIVVDVNSVDDRAQRLELCRYLAEYRPDTSVVVLSDASRMETAIAAMRSGAFDLVTKPIDVDALAQCIRRAASHALVERRLHLISDQSPTLRTTGIVGESDTMLRLMDRVARVASTDVTVLVTGESGTGKELVARALHDNSARASAPFVPINCAAIPSELLEAELFGHVKGAFTDAKTAKEGMFVRAGGGTLFLDEIGEMPADMQVKLLRALQERRVRPVGGEAEIPFDIRVVAATNKDLEQEVGRGSFREDLYYRLNVVRLHAPPLRTRGQDVLHLAAHFLARWAERMGKRVSSISSEAVHVLLAHPWPGNVRELDNVMQRAVALAQHDEIVPADLGELGVERAAPQPIQRPPRPMPPYQAARLPDEAVPQTSAGWPGRATVTPAAAAAVEFAAPGTFAPTPPDTSPPDLEQTMKRWLSLHLAGRPVKGPDDVPSLSELEQIYVCVVLEACGGNKTQAAEVLGMARRTLYRRLKQIEKDKDRVLSARRPAPSRPAAAPRSAKDVI